MLHASVPDSMFPRVVMISNFHYSIIIAKKVIIEMIAIYIENIFLKVINAAISNNK